MKMIELYQEKDEEFVTLKTMCEKLWEYGIEPYEQRTLKMKLIETCKNVYITNFKHNQNRVLFNSNICGHVFSFTVICVA